MAEFRSIEKPSICMFLAAFSALLAAISEGMMVNYSSAALSDMQRVDSQPHIDKHDLTTQSWIASSPALSALLGSFIASPLIDKLGRKVTLVLLGLPLTASWAIIFLAKNVSLIIAGRVIAGISVGVILGSAPIYLIEISPTSIRGFVGCCFAVSLASFDYKI